MRGMEVEELVVLFVFNLFITMMTALSSSVIIIGAGISGISAAKTLHEAGIHDILILEATDRIGGRIQKTDLSGYTIETGANWIEGCGDPKVINPIEDIAKKIKLKTYYSDYSNLTSNVYMEKGGLRPEHTVCLAMDAAEKCLNLIFNLSKSLSYKEHEDISVSAAQCLFDHCPTSALEMVIDYYYYDYEDSEPPRVTSLKNSEPRLTFTDFGDDQYLVADSRGYDNVVHYVAKEFLSSDEHGIITDNRLKLNKVVRVINYSKRGVKVETEDGYVYHSKYVIVSTSIGVLQSNLIEFKPHLPHFEMEYPGSNILMVVVTDDESRRIEQQTDAETEAEAMEVLRKMFGCNIPNATDIVVPRWWSNKFYKGSFSNWPIGFTGRDFDRLKAPVGQGRVHFTGEHTSEKYYGYVHGAYLAGIDSANLLIKCMKEGSCKVRFKTTINCFCWSLGGGQKNDRDNDD